MLTRWVVRRGADENHQTKSGAEISRAGSDAATETMARSTTLKTLAPSSAPGSSPIATLAAPDESNFISYLRNGQTWPSAAQETQL